MSDKFAILRLKKNEDKRLRAGHLWIYSNEVDTAITPLKNLTPGQCVNVENANGRPLGSAYVNPHSLICARLYATHTAQAFDQAFIERRLARALAWRERCYHKPYYRLCFGESDFLPGLVIDRFADVFVVQLTTAGSEAHKTPVLAALQNLFSPRAIVLRNDSSTRELEQLDSYIEVTLGQVEEPVSLQENGVAFHALPLTGQKTGWFYDHRANRARVMQYARGKRVLDVFSYTGAWGISALAAGAVAAGFVDSSQTALHTIEQHIGLNKLIQPYTLHKGDAFTVLQGLAEAGERFDIVIVDPPAFVKRRKDLPQGLRAYQEINRLALVLLNDDGLLLSASCSFHVSEADLQNAVRKAALQSGHSLQLVERGQQAPDHPVHPAMPETQYIKSLLLRVSAGRD